MDILTAIKTCFRKSFVFKGRASRSEFWYWVLFVFIACWSLRYLDAMIFDTPLLGVINNPIEALFAWITLPAYLAVAWRRLHDINRSGWWIGSGFLWLILTLCLALGLSSVLFGAIENGNTALVNKFEPFAPAIKALGYISKWFHIPWGIILFVFFCMPSTRGDNRFGAASKPSKDLISRENASARPTEYRPPSMRGFRPYSS